MTTSNTADKLLNDADYEVSVAEAKVAKADQTVYVKLEAEKGKEDEKIQEDLELRLESMCKGPDSGIALIHKMIGRIGDDPSFRDRIGKALEAAKQRSETPAMS